MLTATLESEQGDVQVRVDDLSAHGARVCGEGLFPLDTPVTFRCKALAVEGFIAWVDMPFAGIGFGDPIEPQMAFRKVTPARQTVSKDFRRPGFRGRRLTDAERRSVEEWARPDRARPGD
ncbi:MAG: hypothetical protein H0W39_10165 [Sphingomonas sp.]|nr:hypothetical protein [Sphingomonas sp.]